MEIGASIIDSNKTNKDSEEYKALYKLYSDAVTEENEKIIEQDFLDASEVLVDDCDQWKEK